MIKDKYLALINRAVDGEITAREQKKLDLYLKQHSEAQKLYMDLIQTADILNKTSSIKPSSNLKKRILDEADFSRFSQMKRDSVLEKVVHFFDIIPKPTPRLAYAFTFGLVLGMFGFSLVTFYSDKTIMEYSQLRGTIGLVDEAEFVPLDSIKFIFSNLDGWIHLKKLNNICRLDVYLNTPLQHKLILDYNSSLLELKSYVPVDQVKVYLTTQKNLSSLSGNGKVQYSLYFLKNSPAPVLLQSVLWLEGNQVADHDFLVN